MKFVGLDVGYGFTKVVDEQGARSFPSVVGSYEPRVTIDGYTDRLNDVEMIDGKLYMVGERAVRASTYEFQARTRAWIESTPYRALVAHALRAYDQPDALCVVTGLPVRYLDDRKLLAKVVKQAHKNVKTVTVLPQPLGTFMDAYLDEAGCERNPALADQTVGVVDLGFYTTDCFIIDHLDPQTERMTGVEVGVSLACQRLDRDLNEKFRASWRIHQLDAALRTRTIKVRGTVVEIADLVEPRIKELAQALQRYLDQIWQDASIDQLILTGGGAPLVEAELRQAYPIVTVDDPAMANARGYYKYAQELERD